ncbi:MAG TPA: hypothetical protein VMV44_15645 [Rectinemataceae bacterium]|nr:hypothetical protein [Rectinemataceae bacterium]
MIEITDEKKVEQARCYMRASLKAFAKVALLYQGNPRLVLLDGYGRMASAMYREFRIKNKFWEVV